MRRRAFRVGDPVIVEAPNKRVRGGRVLCTNRNNKYGHCIVVIIEDRDIETFREDGTRYVGSTTIRPGRVI